MQTKTLIWIGMTIGSITGGYIGSLLDHGNMIGLWSIVFSTSGALGGIWAGYKIGTS